MSVRVELPNDKPRIYHVNNNTEGERFVGIKADTEEITVFFPLGYRLSDDNPDKLRKDARNLFSILSEFMKKEKVLLDKTKKDVPYKVDFPINAYLTIMRYYMSNGYYSEQDVKYSTRPSGDINWRQTIRKQKCIVSGNNFIYTQFTVMNNSRNYNNLLTQINRYCVEESFNKLGWLYLPKKPEPAGPHPPLKNSISILSDALGDSVANKDETRRLFSAMRDMLKFLDDPNNDKRFYFGVDDFTYIWQELIDKAFGVPNVSEYFPHGYWYTYETSSSPHQSSALQEDSVMEYNGKLYILDAKFYKYGDTGNPSDLPPTDSIQKQITYGEYVQKYKIDNSDGEHLFNAFLMPFNKNKDVFKTEENFRNVAEAVGDWRNGGKKGKFDYFERIQGILIDTRFLMYHYNDGSVNHKQKLAECIEEIKQREEPQLKH